MRHLISRRSFIAAASFSPVAAMAQTAPQKDKEPDLDAPYVPTPQDVVDRMLELAKVTAEDYVMDLGCGDGRILITAAAKFGARGFGVDIDPNRIVEAKANAAAAGVSDKVDFGIEDLFHTPIGKASVLALYLFPHINELLAPRMLKEMKPGSRIVTHGFGIGKWRPDRNDMVAMRPIHFYVVPANVEGSWRITRKDGPPFTVSLIQSFQRITGYLEGVDGVKLRNARLAGPEIGFALETVGAGRLEFVGMVEGETISGKDWSATRTSRVPPR
jgi:SAM-dependent methyltransferase